MKLSFSTRGWSYDTFDELIDNAVSMHFSGIEIYDLYKRPDLFERGAAFDKYSIAVTTRKLKDNKLDFNDLEHFALMILKNNGIREQVQQRLEYIFIDEYQDTNELQDSIFANLSNGNNIFCVGDIKQSIYRFRNANPYIFRNKYNDYSNNKNGIKIDLLKNFRSRKEVLNNINLIFNNIMDDEIGDADYIKSHQMNYGNINYDQNKIADDYNTTI